MVYDNANKDKLLEAVEFFTQALDLKGTEINVMFVDKSTMRKDKYKGYMLLTENDDILPSVRSSLSVIKDNLINRSLEQYDLELSLDETVQIVDKASVINGDNILEKLTVNYNKDNSVNKETKLDQLNFIVIQIHYNDLSFYIYKKYVHPNSAYRSATKFTLNGEKAKVFKEDIITINASVDAFLIGEQYFVFDRNNFNSIFDYKDVYKKIVAENTEKIMESGLFTEAAGFINDCELDGRYLPRLTKVILAEGFAAAEKHKDKIEGIIKKYKLSLSIDKDKKIVYKDKKDIPEILDLLLRHYVIDALTDESMLAKAIDKYKI